MNHDESTQLEDRVQGEHAETIHNQAATEHVSQDHMQVGIGSEAGLDPGPSFGQRLRASRERHGMSIQDCSQALRLPIRLLQQLEADDYQGIDYSVYLRGYLTKYASYVRLEQTHVERQLESLELRQPDLVAPQPVSVWRRGLNRYSNAATYAVLSAFIIVPLIWLGLNGVLKRDIARLAPLNATPVNAQSTELTGTTGATVDSQPGQVAADTAGQAAHVALPSPAQQPSQKPLMASMAPFSAMESSKAGSVQPGTSEPVPTVSKPSLTRLAVSLQQPSWVEITDARGNRLEYALLPAGTHRAYSSSKSLNVRIGNADGVTVDVDGKPLALDPYRHANVAHFDIDHSGNIQPDNS